MIEVTSLRSVSSFFGLLVVLVCVDGDGGLLVVYKGKDGKNRVVSGGDWESLSLFGEEYGDWVVRVGSPGIDMIELGELVFEETGERLSYDSGVEVGRRV